MPICVLVLNFYGIETLELNEWPSVNASNGGLSASVLLDASGSGDLSESSKVKRKFLTLFVDESINNNSANANSSAANQLPANMSYAKSLLDDMHDPLGLNDSLYQMQAQRVLTDPKYARFEDSNNYGSINDAMTATSASALSLLLSSPNFDARLYLRLVHQYTSFDELVSAQDHLRDSLKLRQETLKSLVKQNFDRFVNAKNSIDSVYADMRAKGMNSGDYGMRQTTVAVNGKRVIGATLIHNFRWIGKGAANLSSIADKKESRRVDS